jgi:NADH:ubiquinone oxidoreductase subunit C
MTNAELKEFLVSRVQNAVVTDGPQYVTAQIPAESWLEAAQELKQNASTAFDYLFCLSGVDMPDHLMVVYHLESTTYRHAMVVKVKTNDRIQAHIPSVAGIWPTANFHEREAFDLLGIKFTGHPDLRRFFMDDDQGHPLRKDYKDENRIVER